MSQYLAAEQRTGLMEWFRKKRLEGKLDEVPDNMTRFGESITSGNFKHMPLERRSFYADAVTQMAQNVCQLLVGRDVKTFALPNDGFETEILEQFWPMYDDGTVGNLVGGIEFLEAMLGLTYNVYMKDSRYRSPAIVTPTKSD